MKTLHKKVPQGEESLHPDLIPCILFDPGRVIPRLVLLKMRLVPSRKEVLGPGEDLLSAVILPRAQERPVIANNRQVTPPIRLPARKYRLRMKLRRIIRRWNTTKASDFPFTTCSHV